jgi:hypothetical protein
LHRGEARGVGDGGADLVHRFLSDVEAMGWFRTSNTHLIEKLQGPAHPG